MTGPHGRIWHFDLYRLKDPEEAVELDIEDAFAEGISLIEWPERLGPLLPADRLEIALDFADQPTGAQGPSRRPRALGAAAAGDRAVTAPRAAADRGIPGRGRLGCGASAGRSPAMPPSAAMSG